MLHPGQRNVPPRLRGGESWHSTVLKPGEFLVVFPGDAHRIKVQVDGPKTVSKAVFKVCIDA